MEKRTKRKIPLLVPIMIIFCLMVCMVLYTSRVIQNVAVANIHEVGEDRISSIAAQLENYLEMTKSVLWVTADTVDHMINNGADSDDILRYITTESQNQDQHFDDNYTGIYGYVMGEYLDGVGWVPPAGYEPTQRDWYQNAIKANGETTIVSPYLDAQTGLIIISISRMLSNGKDVLSLDVTMNHIHETLSDLKIKGMGYGFIVNRDGMLIAHNDETKKGRYLYETEEERLLMDKIREVRDGNFEIMTDGQKSTVFVDSVMDQWYVVIIISNRELYADIWQQLIINILICTVIFALIAFFYYIGHKNEQRYNRRIEEMRLEEQKQEYEAIALKLEKETADRANKAKSDFLAEMSHEIRTPINAVLGMNEMVLRESDRGISNDENAVKESFGNIKTYAGNIANAGNNLLSIINDILDFSKIESGKLELVYGDYKLSSVLNYVSNMIYYKTKSKGLEFIPDIDETLPDGLYGDEVRVRQIITNILNNAVKYTNSGSICLMIRGNTVEAPEKRVDLVMTVKDTGIGIKAEDIGKLFTKFQRVDLSTNSAVEGTGLGLAISKNLLEMMDGSISVESEYGVGSAFTIKLSQKISSDEPIGDFRIRFSENILNMKAYEESFRAPDAHILIVDDTKMNLTVAVGLLKNTDICIDTANGGEEAVNLAQAKHYDLILMDQRMPKIDGTQAMQQIRAQSDGANRDTPVICLTADAVVGAKERYIEEGFTDYLTKPIDSRELEHMLIKYLPSDKMKMSKKEETKADPTTADDIYSVLQNVGISTETGLQYCQNDDDFYQSMLYEYAESEKEKSVSMQEYINNGDWENYGILVHSLKSTSKMMGAIELSNMAAKLEKAVKEGNVEMIRQDHGIMSDKYKRTVKAILSVYTQKDDPKI